MKRIFVSMDELLDTKLGMAAIINQDKVAEWLADENGAYFKRMHDSWIAEQLGMSYDEWKQRWLNRTVEVPQGSIMTHVPEIINDIIKDYRNSTVESLGTMRVVLIVNTYPYHFNEEDIRDLEELFYDIFPTVNEIQFKYFALKDINYNYLKNNVDVFFIYDYNDWIEANLKEVKVKYMPGVEIFAPRLFHRIPDNQEVESLNKDPFLKQVFEMDIFKVIETTLALKWQLTYLAASDFSTVLHDVNYEPSKRSILDQTDTPDVFYTNDSLQADPLFPFLQELIASSESQKGQG